MAFTVADIPDQSGKLAVITGATGGLGYETALALAGANATVVLTGRNAAKGAEALARVRAVHPKADISFELLDMGSQASIAGFAESLAARHSHIDLLINNAGVMMPPSRKTTVEGFELQLGTNHLGHFALTARLLPLLAGSRVVTVSSIAHRTGAIHFDDLQLERGYTPTKAYNQSKLANLLFAFELQRRASRAGAALTSTAAHPGVSATNLFASEQGLGSSRVVRLLAPLVLRVLVQSAKAGAEPTLYAATAAEPGSYTGPQGLRETRGRVGTARPSAAATDETLAATLWDLSEQLTSVRFDWENVSPPHLG